MCDRTWIFVIESWKTVPSFSKKRIQNWFFFIFQKKKIPSFSEINKNPKLVFIFFEKKTSQVSLKKKIQNWSIFSEGLFWRSFLHFFYTGLFCRFFLQFFSTGFLCRSFLQFFSTLVFSLSESSLDEKVTDWTSLSNIKVKGKLNKY